MRSLLFKKEAVVVAVVPLMIDVRVKELVEVDTERVFEVEDATRLVRSVEVAIPLIVVVRIAPLVERSLEVITDVVAVTPLIVVERVLPVTDWVKELIIVAMVDETPLMIVWKRLADDEATLLAMILVVPVEPPILEVIVLVATVRELVVVRLVMVAFVVVELPMMTLVRLARVATRLEKNPLVEVALVDDRLVAERLVVDALVSVVCPVTPRDPLKSPEIEESSPDGVRLRRL
jgi:hypothetical protein